VGIIIRLINYFNNAGLSLDEAYVALNLMERSYAQLLLPLDNFQVAPVLFLLIEKLSVSLLGPGELALRLFPLVCSILTLPIFYFLARDIFKDEKIALTSLFVFAVLPLQIQYSAAVKQYMSDVFVLLILFWLFVVFLKRRNSKLLILLAVAGVISIFLSNIAVLVLFTLGLYWLIDDFFLKNKDEAKYVVVLTWLVTFGVYYYFFIHGHQHQQFMLDYWQQSFLPLNPSRIEFWDFLNSVGRKIFAEIMLYNRAGLSYAFNQFIVFLFLMIYATGLIMMITKRKVMMTYFMIFPILLHLFLSGLEKYPFDTRLALYLSPLVIMTFSCGAIALSELSRKMLKSKWPGIVVILALLSIYPYKLYVNYPIVVDGARESIQFINEHFRDHEKVYVYYYSKATLEYYQKTRGIKFSEAVIPGHGEIFLVNWGADLKNFEKLHGEVWLLFSHLFNRSSKDHPENIIMSTLLKRGILLKSFQTVNSAAYLVLLD
jgi:hypothetical protein